MNKIFNVRNIIIILSILLVVFYIVFLRSRNPLESKTYDLYYDLINKDVLTMKLSFENEESNTTITFSSDKVQNKAVNIIEVNTKAHDSEEFDTLHFKSINITENGKTHIYQILYHLNSYYDFGEEDARNDVNSWLSTFNTVPSDSNYYTKSYKIIDGKLLSVENFPKMGAKFYYDGNDLKYLTQNGDSLLYTVTFEDSFIDESLTKIPEGFTLIENE